jgi:Asp-tRNA(Asn)/Glu-tRNA(Gln) amidotransferase A subunit family amidase
MYAMIFNVLGLPSTHVPFGFNKAGMPIGIQVNNIYLHEKIKES